jgi:hypothetical protein
LSLVRRGLCHCLAALIVEYWRELSIEIEPRLTGTHTATLQDTTVSPLCRTFFPPRVPILS